MSVEKGKQMLKNAITDLDGLYYDIKNLSKSEVENKYNYKGHTLRMFLRRNGYNVKTFVEYDLDRKHIKFKKLYDEGLSVSEISKSTGYSDDCVYNIFKRNGINYLERNLKYNKKCNFSNKLNLLKKEYADEKFVIFKNDNRYAVSNYGRIWSFINKIFLKWGICKDELNFGYCYYSINGSHISKHRVVALHFIPNPNNYPEVNHLNFKRGNCKWDNLEWTTRSGNIKHSFSKKENYDKCVIRARKAGMKNARKVLCIEDNIIFISLSECARNYGIKNVVCITRVCKGKNKYSKDRNRRKLTFKYYEGDINE